MNRFWPFLLFLFLSVFSAAQKLQKLEYFFDSDPGFGNGSYLSITAADSINISTSVSVTGLSAGMHELYVRSQDSLGNWSLYESQEFYVYEQETAASRLNRMEAFVDSDPGFGNGIQITVAPGDSIVMNGSPSITGLASGHHQLYIRVRDSLGRWSHYGSQNFYVYEQEIAAFRLNRMEAFVDSDPGFGNGIQISVSSGDSINMNGSVPITGLASGHHQLYIRVQDSLGRWSHYGSQNFYVYEQETAASRLNRMEAFVDSDPGFGNGIQITVAPGDSIVMNGSPSITGLASGHHQLYIRVQDSLGRWSHYRSQNFYVYEQETAASRLNRMEAFVDSDPGFGNGIQITVAPGDSIVMNGSPSITGLASGHHQLYIRVQDSLGSWSHYGSQNFYVYEPELASAVLDGLEIFADADPGFGNGLNQTVSSGDSMDISLSNSTLSLTSGYKTIYTRAKDAGGRWSLYEASSFYVYDSISVNSKLIRAEYFIDADPGHGNGVPVSFSATDSFSFTLPVATSGMETGSHHFYLRFLNDQGAWSLYEHRNFFLTPFDPPVQTLVRAEYFFDADPGSGMANTFTFAAADSINLLQNINIGSLAEGSHELYIRIRDSAGVWSHYESAVFFVCNDIPSAGFTHASTGLTLNLNNTTTGATDYLWNFGNGNSSSQFSPSYTYGAGGTYTVKLYVLNGACPLKDSASATVSLFPSLFLSTISNRVCTMDSLITSIATTDTFGAANLFYIQLSDSSGSFSSPVLLDSIQARSSLLHSFFMPLNTIPGPHYKIRVVSADPVSISNSSNLEVYPVTLSDFSFTSDTVICSSEHILLAGIPGNRLSYQWQLDGKKLGGAVLDTIQAYMQGLYRLQLTNEHGCKNLSQKSVYLQVKPVPITPPITGNSILGRNQVELYTIGSGSAGSVYNWLVNGGNQVSGGNGSSISVQWGNIPASGELSVIETASNGCTGDPRQLNISIALASQKIETYGDVGLSPNPFMGSTRLYIKDQVGRSARIALYDGRGELLMEKVQQLSSASESIPLILDAYPAGLYMLRLSIGGRDYQIRLLSL